MRISAAYAGDRDRLIADIGMPKDTIPSVCLLRIVKKIGWNARAGGVPEGHDVALANGQITVSTKAWHDQRGRAGALAKALGHIRLHQNRPMSEYHPRWHWEALCYGAVFCVPLWRFARELPVWRAPGCPDRRIRMGIEAEAIPLGVSPEVVRLALQCHGVLDYDASSQRVTICQPPSDPYPYLEVTGEA